jgi:hypothetical protein
VFSLHCRGERRARRLRNDPRSLFFRVLQCRWAAGKTPASSPGGDAVTKQRQRQWTSISTAPAILLGCGWQAETGLPETPLAWRGDPGAEILVQGNERIRRPLTLELERFDSASTPLELIVTEGERRLVTRVLHKREQLRLMLQLGAGQTTVLRLSAAEAHSTTRSKRAMVALRLVRATWGFPIVARSARPPATLAPAESEPEVSRIENVDAGSLQSEEPEPEPAVTDAAGEPDPPQPTLGPFFLHTNACGDFTLLAREHWLDLRGYPEFDLFSMNIDSVFCYAAHHGGAPEEFLPDPMRIYHIEHATGSGFTPEGQTQLFERIAAKGLSWITYEQVLDWASQMRRLERPIIFNGGDWGFAGIELPERGISVGASAHKHSSQGT